MSIAKVSIGFLHPGHYSACFAESLCELQFYDAAVHLRTIHSHGRMGKYCGSGGIVDGRNKLAQVFLDESAAEWLFMVDSDMAFEPDTIERLIASAHAIERPVVGALAFAHKTNGRSGPYGVRYLAQPTIYRWYEDDDQVGFAPLFDYPRNELLEVGATGAACMIVHRLALEAIRDKYGDVWFDTIRHPKGSHFSEDLSFCIRVAGVGLPLYVDTRIKTGHDKGGAFLDEDYFDRQQADRAKARKDLDDGPIPQQ
jgi:GT2 family glycosyltransferase